MELTKAGKSTGFCPVNIHAINKKMLKLAIVSPAAEYCCIAARLIVETLIANKTMKKYVPLVNAVTAQINVAKTMMRELAVPMS